MSKKASGCANREQSRKRKAEDKLHAANLKSWFVKENCPEERKVENEEIERMDFQEEDQEDLADNKLNDVPESSAFNFDPDPVNWNVGDSLRDYIVRKGFEQNKDMDFSTTKKLFGQKFLYLQRKHFKRVLPNGEEQEREWLIFSPKSNNVFCGPC